MQIVRDLSARTFLNEAGPLLYENEAENSLIIGLVNNLANAPVDETPDFTPVLLRAIDSNKRTAIAFAQTRLMNGIISKGSAISLSAIVHYIREQNYPMDGIAGPQLEAMMFAREYCQTARMQPKELMLTNLMQLEMVVPPPPAIGEMMYIQPSQIDQAIEWTLAFQIEAVPNEKQTVFEIRKLLEKRIASKALFAWVTTNQGVVSMASAARETRNSFAINLVYTPIEMRGRGFASNLVAKLSQHLLDKGKRYVFLNADVKNPHSNSIYIKLGYRNVGVFSLLNFEHLA